MVAVSQIPNLPPILALAGTSQFEVVQAGVSSRVTAAQIADYVVTLYPAPGVSSIGTTAPITGGTITTTGTIGLAAAGVTNTYLAGMPAGTVKANVGVSPAEPADVTPSALLDVLGSVRGALLYRGASSWSALPPGTAGHVLVTGGAGTDPAWGVASSTVVTVSSPLALAGSNISLTTVPVTLGGTGATTLTANRLLLGNGTSAVSALAAGTTGQFLVGATGGPPAWQALPVGIAYGGTGATTAPAALTALGAVPVVSNSFNQIIIGTGAMPNAVVGNQYNIVLGTEALRDAATNDATVAIGYHAAATMAAGRAGVFVGHVAGEFVLDGSSNTFIGGYAGRSSATNPVTFSLDNTFVGEACGLNIEGAVSYNTGMGFNCLFGLRDGAGNSAYGLGSGLSLVHSGLNTLMGLNSYQWGDGERNTIIGYGAGKGDIVQTTTDGSEVLGGTLIPLTSTTGASIGSTIYMGGNLRVGTKITAVNPGVSVTVDTGCFNAITPGLLVTLIPDQADGDNNTLIGYSAGSLITGSAQYTTALGSGALQNMTTGNFNTVSGALAGNNITTQGNNCFYGYSSGRYFASVQNSGFGYNTLRGDSVTPPTGGNNAAFGANSMVNIQGAAAQNSSLGDGVFSNITTGSRNIGAGYNVGTSLTTGTDNILIGVGTNCAAAAVATLNIGNSIYGTGIYGGTLKIGIGDSTPDFMLDVAGDLGTDGPVSIMNLTSVPSGGTAGSGIRFGTLTNFGIFFGADAPTLSAARGSLYIRSNGTGVNDRLYVNTDGGTTWTYVVTGA